jgi:hypothetical protein
MAELDLKFVDENADALDPALRAFGQGADRVSSVRDFVDQVLARLGPKDCIKKLELIGHGSPGNIGVGSGRSVARTGNQSLDLNNIAQWEPQIRRLRCRFCKPDGEFDLIECNTGAGIAGARLLRLIVNFIRCCRAKAPVEPVTPLSESQVDQIVEAIGEGEDEHARLPTPIEPKQLKTTSMRPDFGRKTLIGGTELASMNFYDPSAIVGARFIAASGSSVKRSARKAIGSAAVSAIVNSLRKPAVAVAPVALYAVEGYLQLQVRITQGRSLWLPRGAVVGGFGCYSPFANDTTFLYSLKPSAQKHLAGLAKLKS